MDGSKDLLELLLAGKEAQVRAAGQGQPGHEGPWGREGAGLCATPAPPGTHLVGAELLG